jgi:hypothetical protein
LPRGTAERWIKSIVQLVSGAATKFTLSLKDTGEGEGNVIFVPARKDKWTINGTWNERHMYGLFSPSPSGIEWRPLSE